MYNNMNGLPVLYRTTASGKQLSWHIVTEPDHYYTITQYLPDGKKMMSEKTYCLPKNIGKRNQTTAAEQTQRQALSLWTKKKAQQFSETPCDTATSYIRPMLAKTFVKEDSLSLPRDLGISPKLDGIRAIAHYQRLYSRNGKVFSFLTHIKERVDSLLRDTDIVLDGELYTHHHGFNELTRIVRASKQPHPKETELQYWIFDIVSEQPYEDRLKQMRQLQTEYEQRYPSDETLQFLYGTPIRPSELDLYHNTFVEHGYEGSILRNMKSAYAVGQRSASLLKYKWFQEDEFEIIGFKEGQGFDAHAIIFQCRTDQGKCFFVKPKGSIDYRRELFEQGERYIGKALTVRFQEYTTDRIPRFPVGIEIRDYE